MTVNPRDNAQSKAVLVCQRCGKRWRGNARSGARCPACGGDLGEGSSQKAVATPDPTAAAAISAGEESPQVAASDKTMVAEPATAFAAKQDSIAWFVFDANDQQHGPMSEAALHERMQAGELRRGDLLFRTGWEDWRPAEELFPDLLPAGEESSVLVVGVEPSSGGARSESLAELPGWPELRRSYARLASWLQIGVGSGMILSAAAIVAGVYLIATASVDFYRRADGAAIVVAGVIGMTAAIPVVGWLRRLKWLRRNPTVRCWNDAVVAAALAAAGGAVAAAAWLLVTAAVLVARRLGMGG